MFSLRKKKQPIVIPEPKEVSEMKKHTKKASDEALKNTKQLNTLLKANGFSFQIYKATHGPRPAHGSHRG